MFSSIGADSGGRTLAHEIGHLMGLGEEYVAIRKSDMEEYLRENPDSSLEEGYANAAVRYGQRGMWLRRDKLKLMHYDSDPRRTIFAHETNDYYVGWYGNGVMSHGEEVNAEYFANILQHFNAFMFPKALYDPTEQEDEYWNVFKFKDPFKVPLDRK